MRTQTPIELAWVLAWTIAKDCSQNVLKLFAAQVAGSPQSRRLPGSPLSFLSSASSPHYAGPPLLCLYPHCSCGLEGQGLEHVGDVSEIVHPPPMQIHLVLVLLGSCLELDLRVRVRVRVRVSSGVGRWVRVCVGHSFCFLSLLSHL